MWTTATVTALRKSGMEMVGVLTYSGDAAETALTEDFRVSQSMMAADPAYFDRLTASRLAALNAKTSFDGIQVGSTFDLRPKAPTPLTPKQQFYADLLRYYAISAAVTAGIVPSNDANYLALKASLQAAFRTALIADDGWPR